MNMCRGQAGLMHACRTRSITSTLYVVGGRLVRWQGCWVLASRIARLLLCACFPALCVLDSIDDRQTKAYEWILLMFCRSNLWFDLSPACKHAAVFVVCEPNVFQ